MGRYVKPLRTSQQAIFRELIADKELPSDMVNLMNYLGCGGKRSEAILGDIMKMAARVLCVLLMALCVFPATAADQAEKDAVRAFLKFKSHVETGINYRGFSDALADLNFELSNLEDDKNPKNPAVLNELRTAMKLYKEADLVWSLSFGQYGQSFISATSDMGQAYLARYPQLEKDSPLFDTSGIYVPVLVSKIAQDAGAHAEGARKSLAEEDSQKSVRKKSKHASND